MPSSGSIQRTLRLFKHCFSFLNIIHDGRPRMLCTDYYYYYFDDGNDYRLRPFVAWLPVSPSDSHSYRSTQGDRKRIVLCVTPGVRWWYWWPGRTVKTNRNAYLGVTVPLKNNCRNSWRMARSQAMCGATSQMAPLKRLLPQSFRKTVSPMLSTRNEHVMPGN